MRLAEDTVTSRFSTHHVGVVAVIEVVSGSSSRKATQDNGIVRLY